MKNSLNLSSAFACACAVAFLAAGTAVAQGVDAIYRCGNEYTNARDAAKRGCKLVEGGNVTVVEGTRADRYAIINAIPHVYAEE